MCMWCSASFRHDAESRHSAGNMEHTPEHLIGQSYSFTLIWFPRLLHRAVGQEATMFQWFQPSPWKQAAALSVLSNKLSPGIQMFACTKLIKNFLWHVSHPFYYNVAFYLHTSLFFRDFFYHHVVTSGCAHRDYFLWKKSHVTHEMPLCDWSDALHVNVQD